MVRVWFLCDVTSSSYLWVLILLEMLCLQIAGSLAVWGLELGEFENGQCLCSHTLRIQIGIDLTEQEARRTWIQAASQRNTSSKASWLGPVSEAMEDHQWQYQWLGTPRPSPNWLAYPPHTWLSWLVWQLSYVWGILIRWCTHSKLQSHSWHMPRSQESFTME